MEKLQAAIERARLQRRATDSSRLSHDQVDQPEQRGRGQATPPPASWNDVPRLDLAPNALLRSRIFTEPAMWETAHYDKLRTKILQQCNDNGWKRILVTSATRGCGKTTTCLNLAASFNRQKDRRLMLMEFDMRRPEMARMLRHRGKAGLGDVLEHRATFEEQVVRFGDNVLVAMNRAPHPNPSQAILADSTVGLLAEAEAHYAPDYIIFDTPPILATDDTTALLKLVDCALLIAAAERTTTAQIDAIEKEVAAQTNVLGVVLNACRYTDESYEAGYGY